MGRQRSLVLGKHKHIDKFKQSIRDKRWKKTPTNINIKSNKMTLVRKKIILECCWRESLSKCGLSEVKQKKENWVSYFVAFLIGCSACNRVEIHCNCCLYSVSPVDLVVGGAVSYCGKTSASSLRPALLDLFQFKLFHLSARNGSSNLELLQI